MSKGKPRDPRKEQFWRRTIRQWQSSKLSVRAFCLRHDLNDTHFYAWRRILGERDAEAVAFAAVRILPDDKPAPTAHPASGGIELVVSDHHVIRVGQDFDALTLQRLLALLKEVPPC
jgi:hypothetical protein